MGTRGVFKPQGRASRKTQRGQSKQRGAEGRRAGRSQSQREREGNQEPGVGAERERAWTRDGTDTARERAKTKRVREKTQREHREDTVAVTKSRSIDHGETRHAARGTPWRKPEGW